MGLNGGRLFFDEDTVKFPEQHEDPDHDGPIVTLRTRASVHRG